MSNGVSAAVEAAPVPTTVIVGSKLRVSSDFDHVYAALKEMPRDSRRVICASSP